MYMRTYDEITSQWGSYILPTNDPLGEMQGYEVYSLNSDTRMVEGNLNLNEKIYNLTNYGSGLNLTGNPFTAYIDWESNSKDIKRDDIASAIYYPSQSGSGNYAVYLPGGDDAVSLNGGSRYIAPMQGFFVKAINDGTLSFGNSSRLASLADSRTSIRNNAIKFRLTDENNGTDEVLFRVLSGTTDQFDDASDAVKITPSEEVSYLTLHGDDELDYSVATVPAVSSDKTYKMSVFCKQETDFQLSGIGAVNFDFRYPVYLHDKQLGIYKDLRADSVYSFTHSPEMESQRFEIIFTAPDGISEIPAEIARVTVNNKLVTLKGSSTKHFDATLSTIDGKLIAVASGSPVEGISLAAGLRNPQVCILHLYNEKQSFTQKILIP
jgi:hypothetical protein